MPPNPITARLLAPLNEQANVVRGARWRTAHGDRTRRSIVQAALEMSATLGLSGLTLGHLATVLGISKSGLFSHFSSKEALQLATIEEACEVFVDTVVRPAMEAPEGVPRLLSLCDHSIQYAEDHTFRGGCFFMAVSMEYAGRPGPVRERLVGMVGAWRLGLESAIAVAQQLGQLDPKVDPVRLAFELNALETAAKYARLFEGEAATEFARQIIHDRIASLAVAPPDKAGRGASRHQRKRKS